MLRLERDQDVAVAAAYRGTVAEAQIEAAVRKANIVEDSIQFVGRNHAAELILDGGEDHFRVFNPGTGGGACVQPYLPGVHRGEEVASHQIDQA